MLQLLACSRWAAQSSNVDQCQVNRPLVAAAVVLLLVEDTANPLISAYHRAIQRACRGFQSDG